MKTSTKLVIVAVVLVLVISPIAYVGFANQLEAGAHGVGLLKTADAFAYVGDNVTYQIKVYNPSEYDLMNVNVSDPMLGLNETIPFLAAGNTTGVTYELEREVLDTDPNPLVNTVTVEAVDTEGAYSTATQFHGGGGDIYPLTQAAGGLQPPPDQSEHTPASTSAPTVTLTATLSVPMISVSLATNCRTGPGAAYDYLTALLEGEKAEVVGKYTSVSPPYWVIKKGSVTCWLWGQNAIVEGNTSPLPEMIPPPSPTPPPTSTLTTTPVP